MTSLKTHNSANRTPFNEVPNTHSNRTHLSIVPSKASSLLVRRFAPATCGELVQGAVNGQDFLVNCPIDRFASATVWSNQQPGISVRQPEAFQKVRAALALLTPQIDRKSGVIGLDVEIGGELPRGKGMASSSAELAAVLSAVTIASGKPLGPWAVSQLLSYVEPSDSVQIPGIAHVNHLTGAVHAMLPPPRGLSVLVVDCGGAIDTVSFDRERARAIHHEEQETIVAALNRVRTGLRCGNLSLIAEAATISATLNQRILFKPVFEELLATTVARGALGVNCAHSGTVLGVLFCTDDKAIAERLRLDIEDRFGHECSILGQYQIIGGGCRDC